MHQIEVETLTLKYDTIDLELRSGEFINGTSVKKWTRDHVGGSPMRSVLLLLLRDAGGVAEGKCSKSEICEKRHAVPIFDFAISPLRHQCQAN